MGSGGRLLAVAAVLALTVGCASAAAQGAQRVHLPLASIGGTPSATPTPTATVPAGGPCAAPRAAVRTLSDSDAANVSSMAVPRTLRELADTAAPADLGSDSPRQPRVERSTFELHVAVVEVALLDSGALALSVADPDDRSRTAVVELPDPGCANAASSPRAGDIAARAAAKRVYGGATLLGVGFFDPRPRPEAPASGLGLSPVLHFESGDCNTFAQPSPTATPRGVGTTIPLPSPGTTPFPTAPPGSTPTATQTATTASGTPQPTATPTSTPPGGTISASGSGSQTVGPYQLTAGNWTFVTNYTGGGIISAYALDSGGTRRGTVADCSTSCTETRQLTLSPTGGYRVQVQAIGSWQITIRPS